MKIEHLETKKLRLMKDNINTIEGSKLIDLTNSIKSTGIKEPLIVTKRNDGNYVVLDGNHRLSIALGLKFKSVPCIIRELNESEWVSEHVQLNYFRGEIKLLKLINYITNELDSGTKISRLAKTLGMEEHWILTHYDMGKIVSNEELYEKYVNKRLIKIPVLIDHDSLVEILKNMKEANRRSIMMFILKNISTYKKKIKALFIDINRIEKQIKTLTKNKPNIDPIGLNNEKKHILKDIYNIEKKIKFLNNAKSNLHDKNIRDEIAKILIDTLDIGELSSLLGFIINKQLLGNKKSIWKE